MTKMLNMIDPHESRMHNSHQIVSAERLRSKREQREIKSYLLQKNFSLTGKTGINCDQPPGVCRSQKYRITNPGKAKTQNKAAVAA